VEEKLTRNSGVISAKPWGRLRAYPPWNHPHLANTLVQFILKSPFHFFGGASQPPPPQTYPQLTPLTRNQSIHSNVTPNQPTGRE